MSAKLVEYHQGAIADIKNAIAWYQERSRKAALDFIEELNRAERTTLGGSCCGVFLSLLSIQKKSPQLLFGPSLTAADYRIIGHLASNPC
jgi:ABC-type Fe3+/spermidine/putrescine transport system ATPase subunit